MLFRPYLAFSFLIAKSGENGQGMSAAGGASLSSEQLYWPGASALTARLRRLITAYQRSNRREQLRQEALSRPDGRRRRRREFFPSIAMVTDTGAPTTYVQDGAGVFMTEGSPYMAKGSAYFAKGGQLAAETSAMMTASSLMADGTMYYKERRQRYYDVLYTFGNYEIPYVFLDVLELMRWLFPLSDGLVVRRLISTALYLPSELSLTLSGKNLTGHSSGPLHAWTRKRMRAWRNITTHSLLCVNGSVECRSRLKRVSKARGHCSVQNCTMCPFSLQVTCSL